MGCEGSVRWRWCSILAVRRWLLGAFCLGVLAAAYQARLPELTQLRGYGALSWPVALLAAALLVQDHRLRRLVLLLLAWFCGFYFASANHHHSLAAQLPSELDRTETRVEGVLLDVAGGDGERRLLLSADRWPQWREAWWPPEQARLSLGLPSAVFASSLHVGQRIALDVSLRAPRGLANPGGFDYQVWAMQRGIVASGRIRSLHQLTPVGDCRGLVVACWRARLKHWLEQSGLEYADILQALLLGERRGMDRERWRLLKATGTVHLVAISGLHIGLLAMIGYCFGGALGRVLNLCVFRFPAPWLASAVSLGFAFVYAALAGFSIPTQRALLMVLVLQLALRLGRRCDRAGALLLALLAVLLIDPLAPLDSGFWLSFVAVAVILLMYAGRRCVQVRRWELLRAQCGLCVAMLVPMVMVLGSATALAPVANLLAIALVSVAVVPLTLLAASLHQLAPELAEYLLQLANASLALLWRWLELLVECFGDGRLVTAAGAVSLALALLVVVALWLPRGVLTRVPLVFLLPLLLWGMPSAQEHQLKVRFIDVGQGLAVLVSVAGRHLLYDAGPFYGARSDAGDSVIEPYLSRLGVARLDAMVLSHGDSDHSGGAPSLAAQFPIGVLYGPEPLVQCLAQGGRHCLPGNWYRPLVRAHIAAQAYRGCDVERRWRWGAAQFRLFSARPYLGARRHNPDAGARNNRSCLLEVEHGSRRLLLTGDIEGVAERALLASGALPDGVDWLSVPHHGSRTSSSEAFIERLRPRFAVATSSFNNRYGHPVTSVVARYRARGVRFLNTAEVGAVSVEIGVGGSERWRTERLDRPRFWY